MYIYIHMCAYIYIHIHMCIYICISIYICVRVYIYLCICTYIYIYTYMPLDHPPASTATIDSGSRGGFRGGHGVHRNGRWGTAPDRHDAASRLCFDCCSPHHMRDTSVWQGLWGGPSSGISASDVQPRSASRRCTGTGLHHWSQHWKQAFECNWWVLFCISYLLPLVLTLFARRHPWVPADWTTMFLPPDTSSLSTALCVTSGAVADTGND